MKYVLLAFAIMTCSLNAYNAPCLSLEDMQALSQLVADLESLDNRMPYYDANEQFNFFYNNEPIMQELVVRMNRFLNTYPDSERVQQLAERIENLESALYLVRTAPARAA